MAHAAKTLAKPASPRHSNSLVLVLVLEPGDERLLTVRLLSGKTVVASNAIILADYRRDTVLDVIVSFLNTNKTQPAKLTAVAVKQGKGTFTMARLAVAVANTMGWLYGIPVHDLSKKGKAGKFVTPTYTAPPNISVTPAK